ncbi:MAG: lytic transglycosylase domain-containing protein [Armatimonadetes bacterium]|nr:lytic transglycosylase domain-containing protein [Armatimonadota bacterium]
MALGLDGVIARIEEIRSQLGTLADPTADAGVQQPFATTLASAMSTHDRPSTAGPIQIEALIRQAAAKHGISEDLVREVIRAESDFNPRCVSRAGAMGLMQLMPENCREYGVSDPFDPAQNVDAGVRHLKDMIDQFGRLDLALAAYNAGPGAVRKYGGIPPYSETRAYVAKIRERLGF